MFRIRIGLATSLVFFSGCASVDYSKSVPALLDTSDDVRPILSEVISKALEGRKVSLSSNVLKADSRLFIEPNTGPMDAFGNPLDGMRMGKADRFELRYIDGNCALWHPDSETYFPLNGVICKPA